MDEDMSPRLDQSALQRLGWELGSEEVGFVSGYEEGDSWVRGWRVHSSWWIDMRLPPSTCPGFRARVGK